MLAFLSYGRYNSRFSRNLARKKRNGPTNRLAGISLFRHALGGYGYDVTSVFLGNATSATGPKLFFGLKARLRFTDCFVLQRDKFSWVALRVASWLPVCRDVQNLTSCTFATLVSAFSTFSLVRFYACVLVASRCIVTSGQWRYPMNTCRFLDTSKRKLLTTISDWCSRARDFFSWYFRNRNFRISKKRAGFRQEGFRA